eukprot:gnl/MRDRNA2_/MRDRNA2_86540_c1_seq9.p1 gnl/MRDRNA2_/MRDRNA2_86540_c1~~gnl/MRDRNA2_/MRDRNA2_86540_c1_seq9.p1  ORF type:complete len:253 (-),score=28.43 gnl/MRDRNA2_/MRDRNA2_86540_c1_seq9:227-985(-)
MCRLLSVVLLLPIFVASTGSSKSASNQFRTPHWLVGNCSTIWTSVPGYYKLPYVVQFEEFGHWNWISPILNTGGAEIGKGMFLSDPIVKEWPNGSWAASARDASRYNPGGVTTCCCMYVGSHGPSAPIVLSEYCKSNINGKLAESMSDVCSEDSPAVTPCPADNSTLREIFGDPFIEVYSSCGDESSAVVNADSLSFSENLFVAEECVLLRLSCSVVVMVSAVAVLMYFWSWFRRSTSSGLAGDERYVLVQE